MNSVMPRANGRNIVGCYMLRPFQQTLLHVVSVVGSCCAKFETSQTFSYAQTDAATPKNVGSCCVRLYIALIAGNVEILSLAS